MRLHFGCFVPSSPIKGQFIGQAPGLAEEKGVLCLRYVKIKKAACITVCLCNSFGIGYLMALWDEEKRSLHDRMASTRVVNVHKA